MISLLKRGKTYTDHPAIWLENRKKSMAKKTKLIEKVK